MKDRCLNPNDGAYKRYGGRGIKVCEEWLNFINFYQDMKDGYQNDLTLERIDNSRGYYKNNCKWATRKEQANNTRRNHLFEYNGKRKTLIDWAKFLKVNRSTLAQRIYVYNWSLEKAFRKGTIWQT